MNKKGFTLVELLAVIVIMAVIATIGTVSMGAIRKKANEKMMEAKIPIILEAAKDWYKDGEKTGLSYAHLSTLVDNEYLDSEGITNGKKTVYNPVNNSSLRCLFICVYKSNNRTYACISQKTSKSGNYDVEKILDDYDFKKYTDYYCSEDISDQCFTRCNGIQPGKC